MRSSPDEIRRLLNPIISRLKKPARVFDEAENLRQNQDWIAEEQARKEEKRAIHNAICELQHMTADQQREWLARRKNPVLCRGVWHALHPEVMTELICAAEEDGRRKAVERRARWETRPRKLIDVEVFLRSILPEGTRMLADTIIQKATQAGASKRTLYRAKAKLGIMSERVGYGQSGHFVWVFPRRDS